jgi:predicted dehydrogenase
MATSVQDAWSVMNIANQYEAVFQIGLQYRYKSIYAEAIHEVKKRKCVGDIKLITMAEHRPPFLDKVGQWNKFSCYSGGTLVEKCCHYFDLINLFAEAKPLSVFASGGMGVNFRDFEYAGKKSDIIDNAIVTIDYENGIRANFTLSMFSPIFYEELVLCGDEGRLKATEEFDFFHGQETKSSVVINRGEDAASRSITPMYTSFIEKSGHSGATFFEHKHFVDKIDGKPTSSASAEDGFWSVVVGSAAEESIRSGQPVKIANILAKANAACVDQ